MAQLSKNGLLVENNQSFPNNSTGYITPALLRDYNVDVIDSTVNQTIYDTASAGWDTSISALNTFTASQQPSFNQLNAFTASQLVINSGINSFTQSTGASISGLNTFSSSFNTYTASINQIRSNGVVLGTSTIFNLVGPGTFFSASLVQNLQGNIATLTFTSDNAKLNTSSFDAYVAIMNPYTASTNVRLNNLETTSASVNTSISNLNSYTSSQNIINSSVTASLTELLNLSSSLSGGYATQGELDQSASVLQANIDTKLNTSSFNAYTASQSTGSLVNSITNLNSTTASLNTSVSNLNSFSASQLLLNSTFATTGSNTFRGNQTITGSVFQNVSASVITAQTASIDLSVANYFTLTLSGSTRLNVTNPQPGVTATLVINTSTNASASFSSNVKQPSGSFYAASPSGNIDIISFTAVDSTTVYAFPAQSFV